jgi:hypothetical protein
MHGPYRRSASGLPSRQVCCNFLQGSESTGASALQKVGRRNQVLRTKGRWLVLTEESATHHHCCRSQHLAYQEALTGAVVGIGPLHTCSTALGGSEVAAERVAMPFYSMAHEANARAPYDSPPRRRGRRRVLWRRRAVSDIARGVGDARALLLAALGSEADSHLSLHVASMTLAPYYSRVALPYEVEARVALPYEGKREGVGAVAPYDSPSRRRGRRRKWRCRTICGGARGVADARALILAALFGGDGRRRIRRRRTG